MGSRVAFICYDVAGEERIDSYWRCSGCKCYTVETYYDSFTGPAGTGVGNFIGSEGGDEIVESIKVCPDPADKHCRCDAHRKWNR